MSDIGHGALRVGVKPASGSGETTVAYNVDPAVHPLPLEEGWLAASLDGYVLTCSVGATDGSGLAWVSPSSASLPSGNRNLVVATPAATSGSADLRSLVATDLPTVTVAKGGTGLTALGTAGQVLTVNSGATALAYATPSFSLSAIANLDLLANISGSSAAPVANTVSDVLDAALTATAQGTILYRGASSWAALSPGADTYVLASQGAAANPHWVAPATSLSAIASHDVLANITGISAIPTANTLSDIIDAALTATAQGTILYRDASGWAALAPGTNTYVLASQGASANPHWVTPATGGSGASTANTYIVQTTASDCANSQVLASLSTGILKVANSTGVLSVAGGADLPVFTASGTGHHAGAVPDPGADTGTTKFLREDATWGVPAGSGGTVTSVSLTGDSVIFTGTAGTPVTGSGTLTPSLITQTAHYVLAGPTSAGPTAPTFRALAGADLPSTGLTITQWGGTLSAGSQLAGTATLTLNTSNRWTVPLENGTTITLALSGGSVGQQFTIALVQDATGSCLVTWFSGIKWAGGSAPTLSATADKGDLFTFLCVGTGSYWGMIAGQNF